MIQAVFLDRDGVINEDVPFISRPSQLRLLPKAASAVRRLNDAGIIVIVITNQPVVARNLCSEKELQVIHEHLRKMLHDECGAKLDGIYYCPHHPEKNHPDANPVYRIDCECRKPKTGMIDKAVNDFNLVRSNCVLIGDDTRDMMAGQRAGVMTVFIAKEGEENKVPEPRPAAVFKSLADAVDWVLSKNRGS